MYDKCINSIAVVICEVVSMLNIVQTVQTSWRPQLPLPKEVVPPTSSTDPNTRSSEMNRHSSAANNGGSSSRKDAYHSAQQIGSSGGNKKWSFGRLFRKKKEADTESSSEEDRKAGFVTSPKYRKKDKKKRGSKLIGSGFDHIVVNPTRDNEFFLPFEPVSPVEPQQPTHLSPPLDRESHSRSTNSLDRRSKRERKKSGVRDPQQRHSSSEEEMVSLNSSTTFTKYRSDESLGSGGAGTNGNGGQSRRSRAARNERYYKRLSRDGEVSHGQVPVMYAPQPAQRWKTQPVPLSIYNEQALPPTSQTARPQFPLPATQDQKMRNSASLSHVTPQYPVAYGMAPQPKNLQNTVNDGKRSISYDSHIHLQNIKKPLPPPPPPRDPLRRVNVAGHDHRPISYAFDQSSSNAPMYTGMSGRCVSDDRIWSGTTPLYQSASSINNPPSVVQNRRFITRAERDALPTKKSLPSGLDFRYVAEAAPRSRKPIHLVNQEEDTSVKPPSPVVIRTTKNGLPGPAPSNLSNPQLSTDFWRRGRNPTPRSEAVFNKPRSVSSSRAGELRSFNMPMYSEVCKPKTKQVPADEVDHVVSGSLLIKPSKDNQNNYVEIRNNANKSNSMPNHYQRREFVAPRTPKADSPTPNKYDEYVAEKRVRNILDHSLKVAPDPPQRKAIIKAAAPPPEPDVIMRKKPTNLEDAINELEAIYKSLKLGDESLMDRAERRDIPTPTNFEKYAELHADEFIDDDDDEPAVEPDIVRDDYAYRNIKHANLAIKASESQPPFGIPIGPIAPSPRTDYLHVQPEKDSQKVRTAPFKYPDIVSDDMAVRTLRKDPPGQVKPQFLYPAGSLKKKRATRTQSANIYTLIQRNAAKPSGGDMHDYMELTKSLERAGSMSDIHKETDDIPSTLQLLRNLREQEQGSPKVLPFRHPSQGGAICNLPTVLGKADEQPVLKPPIPLPRKSVSPDPEKTKMEDALNKIAKEARESSEKLTRELMELRKEALITSSRSKVNKPSIERDLEQIEAVSEAAKRCRHILMDTIPPEHPPVDPADKQPKQTPPRRLVTEDKLIKAIDQVSDAANKVCEKILNEIVTVQPPVIVQNAIEVKNRPKQELVMPSLIQKLDPSSARIGEIAERCMRQISELNDLPDYDNLHQVQATACNTTKTDSDRQKRSDADLLIVPGSASVTAAATENEEEIDKIMKECEEQARDEASASSKLSVKVEDLQSHSDDATDVFVSVGDKTVTTTTTSASSSSDCLKSSSPSAGPHLSSSITSFNPYSSSDYIMSPSSEFHAPSTDPIKTFSTTSYDVPSSSVTPNITNSPFSYTPSPPLNRTPVCSSGGEKGERSGSASQYNSSEELAMIFGIEKSSPATTTTGKDDKEPVLDCSVPIPVGVLRCSEPNKPDTDTTTATNPELCESVLVCKLDTIEEGSESPSPCQVSTFYLPSYASNISIIVTSVGDDDGVNAVEIEEIPRGDSAQQFDSLSSIDESSNPDSGNVSLSDFPPLSPINASLEVELAHNSRFEVAKFVNEVTIKSGCPEMDYLRSLFVDDELTTSFSFEEPVPEELGDPSENHQLDTKDQHSPGQLLNEVLSQVSRINAGTNRRQLLSQLENISECTKIVEDLSDRLSHHSSKLKSRDDRERVRERGVHRVRFSDDYETDHDADHTDCLRSLKEIGHHLSSSEESIPPLGAIFSVPLTDSENDGEDEGERSSSDRDSGAKPLDHPALNFDETQKSFREECLLLKEALHRVVHSGLIVYDTDESDVCSVEQEMEAPLIEAPPVFGVVDVIDCVDSGVQVIEVEDDSLTPTSEMVSIIEVADLGEKDDLQLRSLLSEPLLHSSEVVSIVSVVDSETRSSRNEAGLERLNSDEVENNSGEDDDLQKSDENEQSKGNDLDEVSPVKSEQVRYLIVDLDLEGPQAQTEPQLEDSGFQRLCTVDWALEREINPRSESEMNNIRSQFKEFREVSESRMDDIRCQRLSTVDWELEREVHDPSESKENDIMSQSLSLVGLEFRELLETRLDDIRCQGMRSVGLELEQEGYILSELELNDISRGNLNLVDLESKEVSESRLDAIGRCQEMSLVLEQEVHVPSEPEFSDMKCQRLSSVEYEPQEGDSEVEEVRRPSSLESDSILSSSEEESLVLSPNLRSYTEKACLSPVNISLKIVNQVSRVRYVDAEALDRFSEVTDQSASLEEDLESSEACRQASEIVVVESTHESELNEQLKRVEDSQTRTKHTPSPSEGSIQTNRQPSLRHRPSSSPADLSTSEVPATPKTLSLLAQPRYDDRMTTLEHILLACTVGVVTGNDLITMLAIIIGVLTIIAIVLL